MFHWWMLILSNPTFRCQTSNPFDSQRNQCSGCTLRMQIIRTRLLVRWWRHSNQYELVSKSTGPTHSRVQPSDEWDLRNIMLFQVRGKETVAEELDPFVLPGLTRKSQGPLNACVYWSIGLNTNCMLMSFWFVRWLEYFSFDLRLMSVVDDGIDGLSPRIRNPTAGTTR